MLSGVSVDLDFYMFGISFNEDLYTLSGISINVNNTF